MKFTAEQARELVPARDWDQEVAKEMEKENTEVVVRCQDNFTVVVLVYLGRVFVGVAKRNPTDEVDLLRGFRIAFVRAWREAWQDLWPKVEYGADLVGDFDNDYLDITEPTR